MKKEARGMDFFLSLLFFLFFFCCPSSSLAVHVSFDSSIELLCLGLGVYLMLVPSSLRLLPLFTANSR